MLAIINNLNAYLNALKMTRYYFLKCTKFRLKKADKITNF